MKIVAIGDGFVQFRFLEQALHRHFPGNEVVGFDTEWPTYPTQDDQEIQEWYGSVEQIQELAHDAGMLVVHTAPAPARLLDSCPDLKAIGVCRGGPVNVNVRAATERGIVVLNAPGRNGVATAEFTIGMILAEMRNIARGHCALSQGLWEGDLYQFERAGAELEGKVAGVVGLGAVGGRVASTLRALGMRVLAHDPFAPEAAFAAIPAERATLPQLLQNSDLVTLHARLTPETRGLIGAAEIAMLKPTAYLVNTARGGLLDYEALYLALKEHRIAGAALDVFSPEPFPLDHPLLRLPNVTVAPHIAGCSRETATRGAEIIAADLARLFSGERPRSCCNPQILPGFSGHLVG
ncbi:MAG TPA: 2-hydroxyacid dehydrogenase [Symbiobacteriaceae bacterium]|nr:2-hydroxyacid dehydrogenase [Symbiobacteriaceae bacterium]